MQYSSLSRGVGEASKRSGKAWGIQQSHFASVIDDVVGYDVGYEEEIRARLD